MAPALVRRPNLYSPLALACLALSLASTNTPASTNNFVVPHFRRGTEAESGYWESFSVPFGAPGNSPDQPGSNTGAWLTQTLSPAAGVFGTLGDEAGVDSRHGQFLVGFDTSPAIPSGASPDRYLFRKATLSLTVSRDQTFTLDPTVDPLDSYLDPEDPSYQADPDEGRPVELFGARFRNEFTENTFLEDSPFGGSRAGQRNAYPVGINSHGQWVDVGIIAILASLLLPALGQAKRKARLVEEISSARQLMLGFHVYAGDHHDAVLPGYLPSPGWQDVRGEPLPFPTNARYPWRLSPYLGPSIDVLYSGENRQRLRELRQLDRNAYTYAASVYPSLGMNAYFIGGQDTEFPAAPANARFGQGTVLLRLTEARQPARLWAFVSARSSNKGAHRLGYYQVLPPFLTQRQWSPHWSPDLPSKDWGFVAPRHSRLAVAAALDGHVAPQGLSDLQDMRHWCNTADQPEFILQPLSQP
jgi:type II secretory pathway pseudopilin PulG